MIVKHAVAAALLCGVLPAVSWVDGSGSLAWSMFCKSETYRIDIVVFDERGRRRVVNPTELAEWASVDLAAFLSGADSWRHGPVGRSLAASLQGLAGLACRVEPQLQSVEVRLERRANLDAPLQVLETRGVCPE